MHTAIVYHVNKGHTVVGILGDWIKDTPVPLQEFHMYPPCCSDVLSCSTLKITTINYEYMYF